MEIKSIDRETFMELYDLHAEIVYQVALYYSGDEDEAEDITQEVFLKLYTSPEVVDTRYVKAWLKVVARNLALNGHRDITKRTDIVEKDNSKKEIKLVDSCEDIFFKKMIRQERADLVERILDELQEKRPRWYNVLIMLYYRDKTHAEVAESMNLSVKALNVMLYRIRKWVQKRYQQEFDHLDKL